MKNKKNTWLYTPKSVRIIMIGVCTGMLMLFFAGGAMRSIGIPIVLACTITGLFVFRKKQGMQHNEPAPVPAETHLVQQAQKTVEESMKEIDLAVIGTEYRRSKRRSFEKHIDAILDTCISLIHAHIDCHTIAVFFPTSDGGYTIRRHLSKSEHINEEAVIYPGVGVIGSFLKDGLKQLKLTDIVTDSMTLYYYKKDAGIRSLMASPIIADGINRGTIIVDSTNKAHFTDENHAFLSTVASLCGQAVFNSYQYNQHKLDHERLAAMSSTEKYFFQEKTIDGVLDKLVEIIPFAFHCDRLTISLIDSTSDNAIIKRAWGKETEGLCGLSFSIRKKSLANIVFTKHFCIFRNFSQEHYETRFSDTEPHSKNFSSFLAFPLIVDTCKGMILMESRYQDAYSESSRDLMSRLVSSAAMAIEKMQVLQQTENLAIRDGLTGLYNHRQFQHLLKEAITRTLRYAKPLTLVICDIDHFKKVNDTYGHRFGDLVLKSVAAKLQSSVREGIDDTARYGGEEFTLILAETDHRQAVETVDRIRQQIADMVFQNPLGKEMHVTLSFGVAEYGVHAKNQELLIKRADKALYKAKENGRNRVEVYFEIEKEQGTVL